MNELTCATCHGYRLNDQALSVRVGGEKGMHMGSVRSIDCGPLKAVDQLVLTDNEATIARPILKRSKTLNLLKQCGA